MMASTDETRRFVQIVTRDAILESWKQLDSVLNDFKEKLSGELHRSVKLAILQQLSKPDISYSGAVRHQYYRVNVPTGYGSHAYGLECETVDGIRLTEYIDGLGGTKYWIHNNRAFIVNICEADICAAFKKQELDTGKRSLSPHGPEQCYVKYVLPATTKITWIEPSACEYIIWHEDQIDKYKQECKWARIEVTNKFNVVVDGVVKHPIGQTCMASDCIAFAQDYLTHDNIGGFRRLECQGCWFGMMSDAPVIIQKLLAKLIERCFNMCRATPYTENILGI